MDVQDFSSAVVVFYPSGLFLDPFAKASPLCSAILIIHSFPPYWSGSARLNKIPPQRAAMWRYNVALLSILPYMEAYTRHLNVVTRRPVAYEHCCKGTKKSVVQCKMQMQTI